MKSGRDVAANRSKIAAALALVGLPPLPGSPGEIFDEPRVCAVHDKPYLVSYVRGANGLFAFSKTIKLTPEPRTGKSSGPGASMKTLPDDQIDQNGPKSECPWCGATSIPWQGRRATCIHCGGGDGCGAMVCVGRTTAEGFFRCRDSCGVSGPVGNHWVSAQGSTRKEANPQPSGAGQKTGAAPRTGTGLSAGNVRLLSDGNPGRFDLLRPDGKGGKP